jgi:asparagine synthase (glutamine-hydrolysing)
MMNFPALALDTSWFVVMPDSDVKGTVATLLSAQARVSVSYASGRPWLVGNWTDDEIVIAEAGNSRVAVIGSVSVTATRLAGILAKAGDVTAVSAVLSALPGSYHVVAHVNGRSLVRGTASGVRQVLYARADGQVLAADRADVLAGLLGAELDLEAVALSLLDPMPPYPLDDMPMWKAIEAVPPDHFLLIDDTGRPATFRWWSPPEPVVRLADGARGLRVALTNAVAARTSAGGTVSCDLSGGLDSTAVCFLAAGSPAELIAYTAVGLDPADDDLPWAMRAISALPGVGHEILPREELSLVYEGIATADDCLDRPFIGQIDRAQILAAFERMAGLGSRIHLTGFGGDEVLEGDLNYLRALVRKAPWIALPRLRAYHAQGRWPLMGVAWQLVRPRSYGSWWAGAAGKITDPRHALRTPRFDWDEPPRLPPWVTRDCVDLVRRTLRAKRESVRPLIGNSSRHADLLAVRSSARIVRSFGQLVGPTGVPLAAPFLDDQVVEACLAVRAHERSTPWEFKPLIKEAMRGIVPAASLERTTKAESSAEEEAGLRVHRSDLMALCDDSRLAGLGLVEADRLRAASHYSPSLTRPHESLQQTFSSEAWLRRLSTRSEQVGRRS